MRLKHWMGYGCVNAKKTFESKDGKEMTIHVWGMHECGLYRNDVFDIFDWLVKRFDRKHVCKDYTDILDMHIDEWWDRDYTAHATYTFRFR